MWSHGIKKFQMERQSWDKNWRSSVSVGTGHRNSEKDPVSSEGWRSRSLLLQELEKTPC